MSKITQIDSAKYISKAQAAKYIGYSRRQLGRFIDKYKIPTYGPEANRFKMQDLDSWMENPESFLRRKVTSRRRKQGFTPVAV
ncbi:helix-turn-helix domain-containing protein [Maridesulfovibrio ferrireducens]|uniref:helix-turn-helix domain-containing protein n=1 Tax=Maridesulfovibrio ferrireducens TaxID=246191 RepID=UPI001A2B304E|nr:helix-turn-helix domain-containing protein [Maridesulfovibrio ferrireducens]MBI9113036.1 helix-turn-helix domain-containing protein [Maridesulfovibrio ferrireducens]